MNRLQETWRRRAGMHLRFVLAVGLAPLFLMMGQAWATPAPLVLHVSAQGNDAWNGRQAQASASTKQGPFATLARARDELRKLKAAGKLPEGATVLVGDGTYELTETLVFNAQDGGTAQAPVIYRAAEGAKPALVGGRRVTAWKPAGGKIMQADLAALGFPKGTRPPLLVCDGQRMPMARYPNFDPKNPYGGGWAFADGKPVPMYQDVPDEPRIACTFARPTADTWSRPQEVEVFVFPRYNWWNNIVPITRIDAASRADHAHEGLLVPDPAGRPLLLPQRQGRAGCAGEWYVDTTTSTLYFQPPEPGLEPSVVVPSCGHADPAGAGHLAPDASRLHPGVRGRRGARMRDTTACTLAASIVRNVGDYRSAAVGVNGGQGNRVVGNDIHDVGSHGIYLDGGDRVTLTSADNQAVNNYIHHVGLEYKQGVGVLMNGVGNRAAHNYIHDGPRMGIMFSGNNLVIEYNHIRHMNLETEDTGAVYTGGRDWISSRGTVIRYNYFHDMLGFGKDVAGQVGFSPLRLGRVPGRQRGRPGRHRQRRGPLLTRGAAPAQWARQCDPEQRVSRQRPATARVQRLDDRTSLLGQPLRHDGRRLRKGRRPARLEEHAKHGPPPARRRRPRRPDHERQPGRAQYLRLWQSRSGPRLAPQFPVRPQHH